VVGLGHRLTDAGFLVERGQDERKTRPAVHGATLPSETCSLSEESRRIGAACQAGIVLSRDSFARYTRLDSPQGSAQPLREDSPWLRPPTATCSSESWPCKTISSPATNSSRR